jgi:hypothetical protein
VALDPSPLIGDVPENIRARMLGLTDILMPNLRELAILTGKKIHQQPWKKHAICQNVSPSSSDQRVPGCRSAKVFNLQMAKRLPKTFFSGSRYSNPGGGYYWGGGFLQRGFSGVIPAQRSPGKLAQIR